MYFKAWLFTSTKANKICPLIRSSHREANDQWKFE